MYLFQFNVKYWELRLYLYQFNTVNHKYLIQKEYPFFNNIFNVKNYLSSNTLAWLKLKLPSQDDIILCLPHFALFMGIHGWSDRTSKVLRKLFRIRERTFHPKLSRRMCSSTYPHFKTFGTIFWAPGVCCSKPK